MTDVDELTVRIRVSRGLLANPSLRVKVADELASLAAERVRDAVLTCQPGDRVEVKVEAAPAGQCSHNWDGGTDPVCWDCGVQRSAVR